MNDKEIQDIKEFFEKSIKIPKDEIDVIRKDDVTLFLNKRFIMTSYSGKKIVLNHNINSRPDQASNITIKIYNELIKKGDKFEIGNLFTWDRSKKNFVFGEEAAHIQEEENKEYIESQVSDLRYYDLFLESGKGFRC